MEIVSNILLERLGIYKVSQDLNDSDLNNIYKNGTYVQQQNSQASAERHYPTGSAGVLLVNGDEGGHIVQEYFCYDGSARYWRYKYTSSWRPWSK